MRKLALVVTMAVSALVVVPAAQADNVIVGHSGWSWGNPQPQGFTLNAIDFAGGTGYAAGNFGTLLKTADGGLSWQGIATGLTVDLQQVRVLNPNTVIIGAGCLLRRSDDGGATFKRILATSAERNCPAGVTSFFFTDVNNGYVLLSNGTVEFTNDGGQTFQPRTALQGTAAGPGGGSAAPTDIFFTSATTGFATAGGTVQRTTDGGNTWTPVFTNPNQLNGLFFSDANHGFAVGNGKTFARTTDAGVTWTPKAITVGPPADLVKVRCAPGSSSNCLASTRQGDQLLKTTDAGDTFTSRAPSSSKIFAAAYNTASNVAAVGAGGATVISANGGQDYAPVGNQPFPTQSLARLRATSSTVVTAPGSSGTLGKTTDGGHTWSNLRVATSQSVIDDTFPNETTGFALDSSGSLVKTGNGGTSWAPLDTSGLSAPRAVFAPDDQHVLLIGARGVALSTQGGEGFRKVSGNDLKKATLDDYDRTDSGQIFVFGPQALFVSANKGASFKAVPRPGVKKKRKTGPAIQDVDFLSGKVGYVLTQDGRVWVTKNGGKKWTELTAVGSSGAYDMAWGDANNGYLAISNFGGKSAGWVLRTSDGGKSWRPQLISSDPIHTNGLVATTPQTAFALAGPFNGTVNQLFFTGSGGDQGAQSTLTIKASPKTVAKKGGVVTITGKLSPAIPFEDVFIEVRSVRGGSWSTIVPKQTSSTGTFTIRPKIKRPTYVVAQWAGDADNNGDGSNVLTIGQKKK